MDSYITVQPCFKSSSTTAPTVFSLPGMGRADSIMKSPGPMATCLWSEKAMRVSADMGSPWLPVVMSTSCPGS